jgi:hypothetical protein
MTSSVSGGLNERLEQGASSRSGFCCGAKKRWSIWEVAAMVAGFVIFWPLGLLALFLKYKNGEMWPGASEKAPWESFNFKAPDFKGWSSPSYGFAGSGNAAFDAYRRETLKRLDEERRKLDEEQKSFRDFVDRLRRAKDQEEFDRFMAERQAKPDEPSSNS